MQDFVHQPYYQNGKGLCELKNPPPAVEARLEEEYRQREDDLVSLLLMI